MIRRKALVVLLVGVVAAAGLASSARAQDKPANDPKAMEVVAALGKYYLGLKQFTADYTWIMQMRSGAKSGRYELFFTLAMERPNKFAMVLRRGPEGASTFCDGSKLYSYDPSLNTCDQEPAPADLAALATHDNLSNAFVRHLIAADPAKSVMEGVTAVEYRGVERVDGRSAHHLAFKHKESDWELWVDVGDQPLVRKVTADVTRLFTQEELPPGAGAFLTQVFSNWTINQPIQAARFSFVPPADAKTSAELTEQIERVMIDGQSAPRVAQDFSLELLAGGQMKLSDYQGKNVVVLVFWTTSSRPCQAALPPLSTVLARYKDKGVVFFAINEREDPAQVRSLLRMMPVQPTVALDRQGKVAALYKVTMMPHMFVIDKQGNIGTVCTGYSPGTEDLIRDEVERALVRPAPAAGGTTAPAAPAPAP